MHIHTYMHTYIHTYNQLQVKALHTCKSLFSSHASNPTSVHFIHKLGPEVVKLVQGCGLQREGSLEVMTESSQILELLLEATPTAKSEFGMWWGRIQ